MYSHKAVMEVFLTQIVSELLKEVQDKNIVLNFTFDSKSQIWKNTLEQYPEAHLIINNCQDEIGDKLKSLGYTWTNINNLSDGYSFIGIHMA